MFLFGADKFTFKLLLYCITSLSLLVQLAAQSVYSKNQTDKNCKKKIGQKRNKRRKERKRELLCSM